MPHRLHNPARGRTVGLCVDLGWAVHVACVKGHGRRWNVEALAERFPPQTTLEEIAERLVCSTCGSRDGELNIFNDGAAQQRRDLAQFAAKTHWRP